MRWKLLLLTAAFALPVCARESTPAPDALTKTRLTEAKARLPAPRWTLRRESVRRTPVGRVSMVELQQAHAHAVVVVLDENGTPHAECIESAPADASP